MKVLFPDNIQLNEVNQKGALDIYNLDVIHALNVLSKILLKDTRIKAYPDVATFAFFCRKSNLLQYREKFLNTDKINVGRGLVYHVAPSNVPVNFAYSLVSGLLAGNTNIVKVPSKNFEQVTIIIDALNRLVDDNDSQILKDRIYLIQYSRENKEKTKLLSSICDVRVIWGGDQTIKDIRSHQLAPKAFDITFSDRYSVCVIRAKSYIEDASKEKIAKGFYNDTYLFDQNACTSPHMIMWVGKDEDIEVAKSLFWESLNNELKSRLEQVEAVSAVNKLTTALEYAVIAESKSEIQMSDSNLIWRNKIDRLTNDIVNYRCNSGYFFEYSASGICELNAVITRQFQTIAYYGFSKEEWNEFYRINRPSGVDRIVPIGRTTDFDLVWDGYNLVNSLSRICTVL